MSTQAKVSDLRSAMVISMPDAGLGPSVIQAISDPVGNVRFIHVSDSKTGQVNPSRLVLGVHRLVEIHDVVVEHHTYVNITDEAMAVELDSLTVQVGPGEPVRYVGEANPAVFDSAVWDHSTQPVQVDTDTRSL